MRNRTLLIFWLVGAFESTWIDSHNDESSRRNVGAEEPTKLIFLKFQLVKLYFCAVDDGGVWCRAIIRRILSFFKEIGAQESFWEGVS
jgi:hypothetical protein